MTGAIEGIGRRRLAVALPLGLVLVALAVVMSAGYDEPLGLSVADSVSLSVCLLLAVPAVIVALRRGAPPALTLAAATLPWIVGLGAMAWDAEQGMSDIANADSTSVRAMWLRLVAEATVPAVAGARLSAALLVAIAIVLGLDAQRRASERSAVRATAALALTGALVALALSFRGAALVTAYRAFPAIDPDRTTEFLHGTLSQLRSIDAVGVVSVTLCLALAAWLARGRMLALGLSLAGVLAAPVLDRAATLVLDGVAIAAIEPPWTDVAGFTPIAFAAPLDYASEIGTRQVVVDARGARGEGDEHVSIDAVRSRWAAEVAEARARERAYLEAEPRGEGPFFEEDTLRTASAPGCAVADGPSDVFTAPDARVTGGTLRALASAAYDAGAPSLTLLGHVPPTRDERDPLDRFWLPVLDAETTTRLAAVELPVAPPDCAPTTEEAVVVALEVGAERARVEAWSTGTALTPSALESFHATYPRVHVIGLVAVAEDATAQDLVDALREIASWPVRVELWRLLPGPLPSAPHRRWGVVDPRSGQGEDAMALVTRALDTRASSLGACVDDPQRWLRRPQLSITARVEAGVLTLDGDVAADCLREAVEGLEITLDAPRWSGSVTLVYTPEE